MSGSKNQKLKTFSLMRFLESHTDDQHGVTVEEIIRHLEGNSLNVARKSVYADISLLRSFGMDIESVRNRHRREYRLMSRSFQLAELKLLVDTVDSSRFITRKKSLELIKKIEGLTSIYEARQLQRSVHVDGRIKSMNESIYYNVDALHMAINSNCMIKFRYFTYTPDKQQLLRRGGQYYTVSPLALTFSDGHYYLYACESGQDAVRVYRVDRMTGTTKSLHKRTIPGSLQNFNPSAYSKESFSMYGGERRSVTLSFANFLASVVIDRFGTDVTLIPSDNGRFSVTVDVMISPVFLGWVFGFGADALVVSPTDIALELTRMAQSILVQYP